MKTQQWKTLHACIKNNFRWMQNGMREVGWCFREYRKRLSHHIEGLLFLVGFKLFLFRFKLSNIRIVFVINSALFMISPYFWPDAPCFWSHTILDLTLFSDHPSTSPCSQILPSEVCSIRDLALCWTLPYFRSCLIRDDTLFKTSLYIITFSNPNLPELFQPFAVPANPIKIAQILKQITERQTWFSNQQTLLLIHEFC